MARFKRGSKEAKAWGRRMQLLRRHGKRKHPATRKRKRSFRRRVHKIRKFITHPIRAIRHYRRRRHNRQHHIKHQKIPFEEVGALGLIIGAGAANLGLTSKLPITTTTTTSTTVGGPTPPTSPPTPITLTHTITASYQVYQGQPSAYIVGNGFTPGGTVSLIINDPQNTPTTQTQTNVSGKDSTGHFSFNVVELGYGPADTISYTVIDNNNGQQSNTVSVTFPASYPPTTTTTTSTTTMNPPSTSATQLLSPITPQQATAYIQSNSNNPNFGIYGNSSTYNGPGLYSDAAGNLFYITSANQFPQP